MFVFAFEKISSYSLERIGFTQLNLWIFYSLSFVSEPVPPKNFRFSKHQEPKTLRVEWQNLECKDTGFVLFYTIYYCVVDDCESKFVYIHILLSSCNEQQPSSFIKGHSTFTRVFLLNVIVCSDLVENQYIQAAVNCSRLKCLRLMKTNQSLVLTYFRNRFIISNQLINRYR